MFGDLQLTLQQHRDLRVGVTLDRLNPAGGIFVSSISSQTISISNIFYNANKAAKVAENNAKVAATFAASQAMNGCPE